MTTKQTQETTDSGVWRRNLAGWARALFDGIDDAVFVHDLQGRILDANSAASRRLGYSRDEFLRLYTKDIDDPNFATGFDDRLERQMMEGHLRCEGRHRTKDGRAIQVDINTSLIEFNGKPCILAVMRDVTEQKKKEQHDALQFAIAQVVMETRSFEDVDPLLLKTIAEGLHWELAELWIVDPAAKALRFRNLWHSEELPLTSLKQSLQNTLLCKGSSLAGRIWEKGAPVWVPDLRADDRFKEIGLSLEKVGLCQAFGFPIWSSGIVTGVLEAYCRNQPTPDDDVLNLATKLGSQIGQVLERQRVEHALRESQAFYHSLVESLPQNLFRKDKEGRVTFANQRYCNLLKRSLDDLIGKTDYDLFPTHLAKKYRADDQRVLESGKALEVVEDHTLPDGSKIYVEVIKTPIHDASGNVIGTQGLFWDVTRRIQAEQAVAASERRYRQLTEATQDAIIVTDENGAITLFNPAAERLFGYSPEETIGKPVSILMPPEYVQAHEKGMRRFQETRIAQIIGKPVELEGLRKDGSRFPIEIIVTAIEPDEESASQLKFLGAIRDLTERNRMRSVLVQNEKLASIGLLSAGVAHEINNPLAFIGNNLAVLQRDLDGVMEILGLYEDCQDALKRLAPTQLQQIQELADDIDLSYIKENMARLINRTREGVERVAKIVGNLRGFARTERAERQRAYIPDLVDSSLEMIRNRLRKANIRLETQYDSDPTILCVPTQISQVLLNFFVNSVQAIESAKRPEGNWIKVVVRRLREEMLIQVADNGCGIEPENLSKIFDPFYTTKDIGEGTGLGLSISHNIVSAHGGRIEVNSTPHFGTSFRVLLPLNAG